MSDPLLKITNLSVSFHTPEGRTDALKNVSISVNRGELVAVVGESGSGKSVTSLSILGLLPSPPADYTSGSIVFNENGHPQELMGLPENELSAIRGNKIAMIFQEPMTSLNPVLTCGYQVTEAIRRHTGMQVQEAREKTLQLFEQVALPDPAVKYDSYPHQLSGGQKQRVMIAMAMSCQPSLLICDEPTTALDVTVQKNILALIRDLQVQHNMGVIFITHDLGVVSDIADKVVVMYRGAVVEQASARTLFASPSHPYTRALLACRPGLYPRGQRLPVVSDFMEQDQFGVIRQQTTPPAPEPGCQVPAPGEEILLSVSGLTVQYPGRRSWLGKPLTYIKAVDGVDFNIYKGETLGLVGESGCGKTTLGRAVLRLVEPSAGQIRYKNQDLMKLRGRAMRTLRRDIQVVFQDPYSSLNPRMRIGEAIAEPLRVHGMLPGSSARKDRVVMLLEKVGLTAAHFNRYPHEFSGGQRQRIVIARALALEPSFVICDESVSALDVSVQAQVLNLLNDLKKEFGFTTLFISHDLSVVRYLSDRIMVMNSGRIVETGPAEALYRQPQTDYTRKLIESIPGKSLPL